MSFFMFILQYIFLYIVYNLKYIYNSIYIILNIVYINSNLLLITFFNINMGKKILNDTNNISHSYKEHFIYNNVTLYIY